MGKTMASAANSETFHDIGCIRIVFDVAAKAMPHPSKASEVTAPMTNDVMYPTRPISFSGSRLLIALDSMISNVLSVSS
jgi:hypothetical protein